MVIAKGILVEGGGGGGDPTETVLLLLLQTDEVDDALIVVRSSRWLSDDSCFSLVSLQFEAVMELYLDAKRVYECCFTQLFGKCAGSARQRR